MRQRRPLFVALAVTTAVIAAAACSSGTKSSLKGHGDMATGTYQISNFTVVKDGCNFGLDPATANGATFVITVSNGTFSFPLGGNGSATGSYNAGVFDAKNTTDIDASTFPTPYDCVITNSYDFKGATSTVNEADATEKQTLTQKSGTQCAQLLADPNEGLPGTTLPCTSSDKQHVKYVAPAPYTTTGTVVTSTGYGTTLSNNYNSDDTTSTLTASLSVGAQSFAIADNLQCYSSSATGATFELGTYSISGPGTFLVDIQPAAWMAGNVPFGATATMSVDVADTAGNEFIGSASGGSVHLPAAPTTTTGACSMGMGNVPLTGTFYPAIPFAPHRAPVMVKTPAGKRLNFNWATHNYR